MKIKLRPKHSQPLQRPKIRLAASKKSNPVQTRSELSESDRRRLEKRVDFNILLPRAEKSGDGFRFCVPSFDEKDFLQACQYVYYCRPHSPMIIEDKQYDFMEKMFKKARPKDKTFDKPGSDKEDDYPAHVRALGLYFLFKFSKREE